MGALGFGKLTTLPHDLAGYFLLNSLQTVLSSIGIVLAACSTEMEPRMDSSLGLVLGPIVGGIHIALYIAQPSGQSAAPLGLKTAVTHIYACGLVIVLMFLNAGRNP